MSLKGDRRVLDTDVSFFMNEVQTRGLLVAISTVGSGAAMDQSAALVTVPALPSGNKYVGILMNDMVNIDQTRQHINWHKDEVQKGGKVTILTKGYVLTNCVYPGITVSAGQPAYAAHSGLFSNVQSQAGNYAASPLVGRFLSTPDEDGYCKVEVNLPTFNV